MAPAVLEKLKFYVLTFVDYKLFQIKMFYKTGLFSFHDNALP